MPSDQVLGSRLKALIEALPNGVTEFAMKRRAARNEASRVYNNKKRTEQQ